MTASHGSCPCGAQLPQPTYHAGRKAARCVECFKASQRAASAAYRARNEAKVKSEGLLRRYGITFEDYQRQLRHQEGVCAICRGPELIKNRSLAVDHCHATGAVRGLLCSMCNTAIGKLKDSPALLRAAALYIEEPPYACTLAYE